MITGQTTALALCMGLAAILAALGVPAARPAGLDWTVFALALASGARVFAGAVRIRMLIRDLPTTRLGSAAQGYVELLGTARADHRELTRLRPRCLWQRSEYLERGAPMAWLGLPIRTPWVMTHVDEEGDPFWLDDGTGRALVFPHGARIVARPAEVLRDDDRQVRRASIRPGDRLYVLGQLTSHQPVRDLADEAQITAADWTMSPEQRRRFDSNGDGVLDDRELLNLRLAAAEEARRTLRRPPSDEQHRVMSPPDGRPFVISTLPPARLFGAHVVDLAIGLGAMAAAALGAATTFSLMPLGAAR
jgi:hypothetical protein